MEMQAGRHPAGERRRASAGTRWQRWKRLHAVRVALVAAGALLIVAAPAVGILPGPGGVFVFVAGVALLLDGSDRAKRGYVRLKRRWPKLGEWVDWGLRRPSYRRRRARAEAAAAH